MKRVSFKFKDGIPEPKPAMPHFTRLTISLGCSPDPAITGLPQMDCDLEGKIMLFGAPAGGKTK